MVQWVRTSKEAAPDQIEDLVEYLVDVRGITNYQEMTADERDRLGFWILVEHKMYKKMLSLMQEYINKYIAKLERKRARKQ